MQKIPKNNASDSWRRLLHLGEKLLARENAASQCQLLSQTLQNWTGGKVQVWLLQPNFPLPGETGTPILASQNQSPFLKQVIESQSLKFKTYRVNTNSNQFGVTIAVPLISENQLLGIFRLDIPNQKSPSQEFIDFLEDFAGHASVALQIHRQEAIKNWRTEQLSLVRKVSSAISNLAIAEELYDRLVDLIRNTFNYYNVMIYSLDEKSQKLFIQSSAIREIMKTDENIREPAIGDGLIGYVASTGKEYFTPNVKKEPKFRYSKYLPDTRSEATLPIRVRNKVIGILDIQSNQQNAFNELDLFYLKPLADNIGIALNSAGLYRNLKKRADQISALLDISRALNSILDVNLLAQEVTRLIHDRFKYPIVHFYVIQKPDNLIIYRSGSGVRSEQYRKRHIVFHLDDPKGIIPFVARTGKTYLTNNVQKDAQYRSIQGTQIQTNSELTVPIVYGQDILAVLDVQSHELDAFDDDDRNLIESSAVSIAITLRNANLYREELFRRKVADSFHNITSLLTKNVEPGELLKIILTELDNTLPCDCAAIWLLEEPGYKESMDVNALNLAAFFNVSERKLEKIRSENPVINQWLSTALLVDEPIIRRADDPYGPLGAVKSYSSDYSSIAMPLKVGEQVLGVLTLAHPKPDRYGAEASSLTATFANYAALAIQNARNLASAQSQAWTSTILLQVAESTRDASSTEELLNKTAKLIQLLIGVKRSAFFICNGNQSRFVLKASYGLDLQSDELFLQPNTSPAIKQLLTNKSSIVVENPQKEISLPQSIYEILAGTIVLVPILMHGEVLGALLVVHEPTGSKGAEISFDAQTLSILEGIGNQISVGIENIRLEENRQEEAYVTAVLLQVAQAVVSQNNLEDILDTIIHLMPILVGIDTCVLYSWDKNTSSFTPIEAFYGSHQKEAQLLNCCFAPHEFKLLDWIVANNKSKVCKLDDEQLEPEEWVKISCENENTLIDQNSPTEVNLLLGYPISVKGEVYGVLLAREMNVRPEFHLRRLDIIQGISQQIAMAFQNDLLQKEMVTREGLQREIQLARQIQRTFLPDKFPAMDGWDLDVRWQTARQVGGDFYDVFQIDDERIGLVIADVSDKGIPAALYMTVARTLIRAQMQSSLSPGQVLKKVNQYLLSETPDGLFVTAIYCTLDIKSGELLYANAGHNLPYVFHSRENKLEILPKGGIALGVISEPDYPDRKYHCKTGDFFFLYTDGLTETFSPSGEEFGIERLVQILQTNLNQTPSGLLSKIDENLVSFRGEITPEDDVTLMMIQRKA